jgi:hypothetical protein
MAGQAIQSPKSTFNPANVLANPLFPQAQYAKSLLLIGGSAARSLTNYAPNGVAPSIVGAPVYNALSAVFAAGSYIDLGIGTGAGAYTMVSLMKYPGGSNNVFALGNASAGVITSTDFLSMSLGGSSIINSRINGSASLISLGGTATGTVGNFSLIACSWDGVSAYTQTAISGGLAQSTSGIMYPVGSANTPNRIVPAATIKVGNGSYAGGVSSEQGFAGLWQGVALSAVELQNLALSVQGLIGTGLAYN